MGNSALLFFYLTVLQYYGAGDGPLVCSSKLFSALVQFKKRVLFFFIYMTQYGSQYKSPFCLTADKKAVWHELFLHERHTLNKYNANRTWVFCSGRQMLRNHLSAVSEPFTEARVGVHRRPLLARVYTSAQVCQSAFTCPSACAIGELRMKSVGAKTSISATASSFSWKRRQDESCLL